MRLTATRSSITSGGGAVLDPITQEDPTLDLNFADSKALLDDVDSDNPVTFTRASSATYVGADGLIKTTPVNLLQYSERFDQWDIGTNSTVTTNVVTAPDGTQTADRINSPAVTSTFIRSLNQPIVSGKTYTFSVYAKAVTPGTNDGFTFGISGTALTSPVLTATAEWQRFTYTTTAPANGEFLLHNFGDTFATDIYIWGAQLEEGSTATPYIPTTNTISGAPRFDHDFETGESLGLLIEEARTNLVTHSDLSSAVDLLNVTNTASTEVNPQGAASCRRLLSNGGFSSNGHRFRRIGGTTASANNITVSAFVKKDTHRYVYIGWGGTLNSFTALFDIEPHLTGDRLLGQGGIGTRTNIDAGYENYPNGWVRIFASGTTSGSDGLTLGLSPNASQYAINAWTANGTEAVFVHGAQYEDNVVYPTSYIPTSGSAVTRAADLVEITGNKFAKTNLLQYSERFDEWTVAANSVIMPNSIAAPDGSLTADKVYFDTNGNTNIYQNITLTQGKTYTFSVYAKAVTPGSDDQFIPFINSPSNKFPSNPFVATSEWQRFTFTFTHVDATASTSVFILNKDDAYETNVYFWGAQLEEGNELTDYTPSVESFVSRASSATYVDGDGVIRTAPLNLLTYSEELNNWLKTNTTVTSNVIAAPDGSITADQLNRTSTGNSNYIRKDVSKGTSPVTYTASFYFKKDDARYVSIRLQGNYPSRADAVFDLDTGTVSTGPITFSDFSGSSATIVPVTDGWYRCSLTATTDSHAFVATLISCSAEDDFVDGQSTDINSVYVWGTQLEEGSTATDYIPTTSTISGAARYENGELILEEARTNLIPDSRMGSGFTETGVNNSLATNEINPEGTTGCRKIRATTEPAKPRHLNRSTSTGNNLTVSVFVKFDNWRYVRVGFGGTGHSVIALFDIDPSVTGDRLLLQGGNGTHSNIDAGYENYSNGWIRIWVSGTTVGTGGPFVGLHPDATTTTTSNWPADGTESVFAYGMQYENNATFPTSYIPTSGSAVTRAADVSTSALGVDSFYNQSEGTVFSETTSYNSSTLPNVSAWGFDIDATTATDRIWLYHTKNQAISSASGTTTFNLNRPDVAAGDTLKAALALKANDAAYSDNGNAPTTDTSVTLPTVNRLYIGKVGFPGSELNGHIKRLTYFPTRLPDTTLQEISFVPTPPVLYTFLEYTTVANTSSFQLRATNASNNYEVDWGDGTVQNYTTKEPAHTYATAGTYTIKITPATGTVYNPFFVHNPTETYIAEINGTGGTSLTSLQHAFYGAANLTSISADIDTVNVVNWHLAFASCSSLTTFPALDTSCGTNFTRTWEMCTSLTAMPSLDFSSATEFNGAWQYSSSFANFPANMFDNTGTITGDWANAFRNCALTAQSIENILVSLDTNGTTNNTLRISGGSNAAYPNWTQAAKDAFVNLSGDPSDPNDLGKGWIITYNDGTGVSTNP